MILFTCFLFVFPFLEQLLYEDVPALLADLKRERASHEMTTVRHPHGRKEQAKEEKRPSNGFSQQSTWGPLELLQQPRP